MSCHCITTSVSCSMSPVTAAPMKPSSDMTEMEKITAYTAIRRNVVECQRRPSADCAGKELSVKVICSREDVARAPHGLDHLFHAGRIDLLAQTSHVHVDQVSARVEVVTPHCFEQHGAGNGLAGVAHHEFEHAVFGRQQHDLLAVALDLARDQIEFERADA